MNNLIEEIRQNKTPWLVLVGCTMIYGCIVGVLINCTGLFITAIIEDKGFSNSAMSLYYTVRTAVVAVFVSFAAHIYLKSNFKYLKVIYVMLSALIFGLMSVYQQPWHWYLSALICGIVLSLTSILVSSMIKNWFLKRTNTMLGICFAGSGVVAALASPLLTRLIRFAGWRLAALIVGVITLVVMAIAVSLFPERSPEKAGKIGYGAEGKERQNGKEDRTNAEDRMCTEDRVCTEGRVCAEDQKHVRDQISAENQARAENEKFHTLSPEKINREDSRSVLIMFGILGGMMTGQIFNNYMAQFTVSLGNSLEVGASMVSLFMIGNLISKVIYGVSTDKIGVWRTSALFYLVLLAGYAAVLFSGSNLVTFRMGAFCLGASCSFTTIAWTSLCLEEYGKDFYEVPYGHLNMISNVITGILLFAVGAVVDMTGSYYPIFFLSAAACILSIVLCCVRGKKKQA